MHSKLCASVWLQRKNQCPSLHAFFSAFPGAATTVAVGATAAAIAVPVPGPGLGPVLARGDAATLGPGPGLGPPSSNSATAGHRRDPRLRRWRRGRRATDATCPASFAHVWVARFVSRSLNDYSNGLICLLVASSDDSATLIYTYYYLNAGY